MNAYSNRMFFRNQIAGTWESWKEIWHSSNFNPDSKANTSGTYSGLNVGNSDLLDNLHSSAFSQEFNYTTTDQNTGYYKINIIG